MPRSRPWPALIAALALLCLTLPAGAAERIVEFHSDIQVFTDASMEVTEHITVQAEGRDIKRGIYRDFPTHYEDRFGNDYAVGFELLDVRTTPRGVSSSRRTERSSRTPSRARKPGTPARRGRNSPL